MRLLGAVVPAPSPSSLPSWSASSPPRRGRPTARPSVRALATAIAQVRAPSCSSAACLLPTTNRQSRMRPADRIGLSQKQQGPSSSRPLRSRSSPRHSGGGGVGSQAASRRAPSSAAGRVTVSVGRAHTLPPERLGFVRGASHWGFCPNRSSSFGTCASYYRSAVSSLADRHPVTVHPLLDEHGVDVMLELVQSTERELQRQCELRARVDQHSWERAVMRGTLRAFARRSGRRNAHRRGAGRPRARRVARATSRSGDSSDPDDPEPALGRPPLRFDTAADVSPQRQCSCTSCGVAASAADRWQRRQLEAVGLAHRCPDCASGVGP